MTISELLVIYFSAGAPVAVYFYLQNRAQPNRKKIWRLTVFTFLFWIPAAARLLFANEIFRKNNFPDCALEFSPPVESEEKLRLLQKRLEKILQSSGGAYSVFEFRETLERYVGLTLAAHAATGDGNEEFFLVSKNKNHALAARCLARRNLERLQFHRISARADFLQAISLLSDGVSDKREIARTAREFAKVLEDYEMENAVEKTFAAATARAAREPSAKITAEEKHFLSAASASRM